MPEAAQPDPRLRDQAYLRGVQYADGGNLSARVNLHAKYGRGDWFAWHASQYAWPARAEVLEVGCGTGLYWAEAAQVLPRDLSLTLTDASAGMVREALARVRAHFPDVRGEIADAAALPFADASFDVVVANHMLYHLPEPELGVAEIARVLRPGGAALIATNGADNLKELFAVRREALGAVAHDPIVSTRFRIGNAEPILDRHFSSVVLQRYPDTLRCTDEADILSYICSSPPGADADAAQLASLRAAIARAFAREGGVFAITKSVGLFICRKDPS